MWHNLPFGGAGRALYDHARGLVAAGHELEFFSRPGLATDRLPFHELGRVHEVPLEYFDTEGTTPAQMMWNHYRRFKRMYPGFIAHAKESARMIDAGGFDLLFANTCEQFHTPQVGRFVTSLPKLLYLQDPFRWLYEPMPKLPIVPPGPDASLKAKVKDLVDLQDARKRSRDELDSAMAYDKILVNSFFSREAILRAFGLESEVCYLGIDLERFSPDYRPAGDYVFGFGTLGPQKGVTTVIEGLAAIPEPGRPRLVWSGNMVDPIYTALAEKLAADKGVRFEVHRNLPDEEIRRMLTGAITLVYASRLEPFGLVPLEANASGLAVVAVAEGGVRETIRDGVNGLLVDSAPHAIAAGVMRLRDDPELRDRMGRQARREVEERWSLAAGQARLNETIERFMASRGPRAA